MAVTKIWSVKGTLKSVVDYAMNPDKTLNDYYTNSELQSLKDVIDYAVESEKTEMQYFVSGINCKTGLWQKSRIRRLCSNFRLNRCRNSIRMPTNNSLRIML